MNLWRKIGIWAVIGLIALAACGNAGSDAETIGTGDNTLRLKSSVFASDGSIPQPYTCDGEDKSPPLSWAASPAGTQGLALIVDDPDAPSGTWVHWVLFNLSPSTTSLPEAMPADAATLGGALSGSNSWNQLGYGGPCPPKGSTHRYFFRLYALDSTLALAPGASKADVEEAMTGHILAQGQLVGRYGR
jgi:Raf kinase inhibitor-like YbhB/YbcL family protein